MLINSIRDVESILKYYDRIEKAETSLFEFTKLAWDKIEPSTTYTRGWCLEAMCEHLEALSHGEILRLLINIPPGCMKSLMLNVFFPAWEWGPRNLAHLRFLKTSHNIELPIRDNIIFRNLITSDWYQEYYPHIKLKIARDKKVTNSKTGFAQVCAFGSLTGNRSDRLLIDDPISTEDAESKKVMESRKRIFEESVPTRLVDPEKSAIVIIMQRLNPRDTSALALEQGYEHLMLPMEFEGARRCTTKIGFTDPRTAEGELLFPERFSRETVDRDKKSLGIYGVACQNQQNPVPREGGIIEFEWVKNRFILPKDAYGRLQLHEFKYRYQSWDTAFKDGQQNDYSVCTTWGIKDTGYYLLHCFRKKCKFPELEDVAVELAAKWAPNKIFIEDKASGISLGQALKKRTNLPFIMVEPEKDKVMRLNSVSGYFEAERVWFPEGEPWLKEYLEELTTFPASAHDDQVDTTSQFFIAGVLKREGSLKAYPGSSIAR